MDKRDWYYKQLVAEDEMDEAFDWVESATRNLCTDWEEEGLKEGGLVAEHSPTENWTVDVAAGVAYTPEGKRCYWAGTENLDCSVDEYGAPTEVTPGSGKQRWISVFVRFKRNPQDPETDGNGLTVDTKLYESFELFVRQAVEEVVPATTKPPLMTDAVLLADILLYDGMVQIDNSDIDYERRESWLHLLEPAHTITEWEEGTALDAVSTIIDVLNDHISDIAYSHGGAAITFTFTDQWYGAVDVGGGAPTTVADALNAIVADLATAAVGTGGAEYVGAKNAPPWADIASWVDASVQAALESLGTDLNNHIGGAAPFHPAGAVTFTPYDWIAATDVQAAIEEVCDDLAAPSGAGEIGTESIAGTPESIGISDVMTVLTAVYGHLNDRTERASDETITGDWDFRGTTRIGKTLLHDVAAIDRMSAKQLPLALDNTNLCREWAVDTHHCYPWSGENIYDFGMNMVADIALVKHDFGDGYGTRVAPVYAVYNSAGDLHLHLFDPLDFASGPVISTSCGPAVGGFSAMASDGVSVAVLTYKTAGNDSLRKYSISAGAFSCDWEQNFPAANSLALGPEDSICYARAGATDYFLVAAGAVATNAANGPFFLFRGSDGTITSDGNAGLAGSGTEYPDGGICTDGSEGFATVYDPGSATRLISIDLGNLGAGGTNGPHPVDGAVEARTRDMTYDGSVIWFPIRYPASTDTRLGAWKDPSGAETLTLQEFQFTHDGYDGVTDRSDHPLYLCRDGLNVWCEVEDDGFSDYLYLSRVAIARWNGDNGDKAENEHINLAESWSASSQRGSRLCCDGAFIYGGSEFNGCRAIRVPCPSTR